MSSDTIFSFTTGQAESNLLEECGKEFLTICVEDYGKVLFALGDSLPDFLNNFDNFIERFSPRSSPQSVDPPSFYCVVHSNGCYTLEVHFQTKTKEWEYLVMGLVKNAALLLFGKAVTITFAAEQDRGDVYIREHTPAIFHIWENSDKVVLKDPGPRMDRRRKSTDCFRLCCLSQNVEVFPEILELRVKDPLLTGKSSKLSKKRKAHSKVSVDLCVDIPILCTAFPFHIIFSEDMQIQQLGSALGRLIGPMLATHGRSLDTYFELTRPSTKLAFQSILSRRNRSFFLLLKAGYTTQMGADADSRTVELKGQMIHVPESSCIMYLGSVMFVRLEELKERGLFLSDIPIHDAARDLILVSEQALAQDALKKRMQQLRKELDQASVELAKEKKRTEDLLEGIFPHDVAKKLIHRQPVPARFIEDVSILFSDIVGFTSIAAKSAPMDVVELLSNLYTLFDKQCEEQDLYKVGVRFQEIEVHC